MSKNQTQAQMKKRQKASLKAKHRAASRKRESTPPRPSEIPAVPLSVFPEEEEIFW
jgi:hypothetical protein